MASYRQGRNGAPSLAGRSGSHAGAHAVTAENHREPLRNNPEPYQQVKNCIFCYNTLLTLNF